MIQGPAGSGKSSILIDIACQVKANDPEKRVLFISGEMTKIDMKGLVDRFKGFKDLDILFLNEYNDMDTRVLLDSVLSAGWDMVIVDSFNEVLGSIIDTATAASPINSKSGEKWLINQFLKQNQGGNDLSLPTMFFFILQVGKDGKFVGSNRIKHAATAFLHLEFTKNRNLFLYFSKNRRGDTYNNLYFEHFKEGIHYDFDRYNQDIEIREALKSSELSNKENWAELLKANSDDANTKITIKDEEIVDESSTSIERQESLENSVFNFQPIKPPEATPIPDRRVITHQIDLEECIKEVETEIEIVEAVITEDPDSEKGTQLVEEVEEEEVTPRITLDTMSEHIISEELEVEEEDEVDEVEEIEEKKPPKDNPNASDFSSLVNL
jgi:hypothetical protein